MCSKIFILATLSLTAMACSNKSKIKAVTPAAAPITAATPAPAPPISEKTPEKNTVEMNAETMVCEREKESRQLRLTAKQPKGCELFYSNFSTKDSVASSSIANTHCQKVQDNIKQKLEAAGFKCNLVMKATTPVASPTPSVTPSATPAATSTPKK